MPPPWGWLSQGEAMRPEDMMQRGSWGIRLARTPPAHTDAPTHTPCPPHHPSQAVTTRRVQLSASVCLKYLKPTDDVPSSWARPSSDRRPSTPAWTFTPSARLGQAKTAKGTLRQARDVQDEQHGRRRSAARPTWRKPRSSGPTTPRRPITTGQGARGIRGLRSTAAVDRRRSRRSSNFPEKHETYFRVSRPHHAVQRTHTTTMKTSGGRKREPTF